jgi:rSAM/selenodomain-associated transferase 2/rSAM/selenodomain-associated transferase 1
MSQRLMIFTRFPEPHRSKTRLIPALGPVGAAVLQREMTRHTLRRAQEFAKWKQVPVEVHFDGGSEDQMEQCFGTGRCYRPQSGGDLGSRMRGAFERAFGEGIRRAVIVGTDCPGASAQVLRTAFDRLEDHDLVLGPATDGGYYLIGLRRPAPQLFAGISWGSETVLEATLRAAHEVGLSTSLLQRLTDVDRPQDLHVWRRARRRFAADLNDAQISLIIPALNEEAPLDKTLRCLQGATNVETIVVDGGSQDRTREIARSRACHVLTTEAGRARQMNAGAAAAGGSILLFLHADTRLPERFAEHVRKALAKPAVAAGAFRLRLDAPGWPLRVVETAINLRSRWLAMPYGDQAIFLPADAFYLAGAFADVPILEDFELVRRLQRRGRIAILSPPVVTSARRWQARGVWRTTWINQRVVLGYYLGVPPKRLARWYAEAATAVARQSQR